MTSLASRSDSQPAILPPRHHDDLSGHGHRQLVGYAGLFLPILLPLVVLARQVPDQEIGPLLDSISAYYYTGAVAIFTGLLVALSLLLLTYRGYENEYEAADRWIASIGGVAAFCVAFCPAKPPDGVPELGWWGPATNLIHYTSATILFFTFIVFSLWLFRKTGEDGVLTADKRRPNRIYLACGLVMIASVVWVAVAGVLEAPIIIPESIALIAFAVSWLTKGQAIPTWRRAADWMLQD